MNILLYLKGELCMRFRNSHSTELNRSTTATIIIVRVLQHKAQSQSPNPADAYYYINVLCKLL